MFWAARSTGSVSCLDGALIGEELCKMHIALSRCQIQRSQGIPVLGCCVGAMLDEEPCEIQMTT